MANAQHISVCICTFKRPEFLRDLFKGIGLQETGGLFTYSIVVVDNDWRRSAEPVVAELSRNFPVSVSYCHEPTQNIALARNKAVANATGDFVAFIDDDEVPTERWLLALFQTCVRFGVDGALGPVHPHYPKDSPQWVIKGGFYDRPTYPTGMVIDWRKGRTGNVLLRRHVVESEPQPFRPEFRASEDQDFFRRMIARGYAFVWCNEAVAYEAVPPIRWKRTFLLKRALLRGQCARLHPDLRARDVAKSFAAVLIYGVSMPFMALLGQHRFMSALVRLCDHLGKVLAVVGINLVKDAYVTE